MKSSELKSSEPADVARIRQHMATEARLKRTKGIVKILVAFRRENSQFFEGPMRNLIAVGEAEQRPYDISSLAAALDLPRTTVFRHLEDMQQRGVVRIEQQGRRSTLYLTDVGWREVAEKWRYFDPIIDEFGKIQVAFDEHEDG
jgi:DNA-binding MarR family transcriptional regulator